MIILLSGLLLFNIIIQALPENLHNSSINPFVEITAPNNTSIIGDELIFNDNYQKKKLLQSLNKQHSQRFELEKENRKLKEILSNNLDQIPENNSLNQSLLLHENEKLKHQIIAQHNKIEELQKFIEEQNAQFCTKLLEVDNSAKINQTLVVNLYEAIQEKELLAQKIEQAQDVIKDLQTSYFKDFANLFIEKEDEQKELENQLSNLLNNQDSQGFKCLCKKLLENKLNTSTTVTQLQNKIISLEANANQLKQEIKQLRSSGQQLISKKKELEKELEKEIKIKQQLIDNNPTEHLTEKIKAQEKKITDLRSALSFNKQQNYENRTKLYLLEEREISSAQENEIKVKLLEELIAELQNTIETKNNHTNKQEQQIVELKQSQNTKIKELNEISNQIKKFEQKIQEFKENYAQKEAVLTNINKDLQHKLISEKKSSLEQKESEKKNEWEMRKRLEQTQHNLSEKNKKKLALQKQVKTLLEEKKILEESLNELHKDFYLIENDRDKMKKEVSSIRDLVLNFDHHHRNAQEKIKHQKNKIKNLKTRINNQAPIINDLENTVKSLQNKNHQLTKQKHALLAEIKLTNELLNKFEKNQSNLLTLYSKQSILLELSQKQSVKKKDLNSVITTAQLTEKINSQIYNQNIATKPNKILLDNDVISFLQSSDSLQMIEKLIPSPDSISSIGKSYEFIKNATTQDKLNLIKLKSMENQNIFHAYQLLLARKHILGKEFNNDPQNLLISKKLITKFNEHYSDTELSDGLTMLLNSSSA